MVLLDDLELSKKLMETLPLCMDRIRKKMRSNSPSDLSIPQFRVLGCVFRGRNKIGEIAKHFGISQPAVSHMVTILIQKNLIERDTDFIGDRRTAPLRFTKEGKTLFLKLRARVRADIAEQIAQLKPKDKSMLNQGLQQMERIFTLKQKTVTLVLFGAISIFTTNSFAQVHDAAHIQTLVQPMNGKSFDDVFKAALIRSEAVGIQDELLVQANEGKTQASGALFPTVSGSVNLMKQENPNSATGSAFFPTTQNTVKVTADQPLFRGLREYAAIRQKNAQFGMQKYALQDAARQLFYSAVVAYYNVIAFESDVANYKNEIEESKKRLKVLVDFERIGRSRETDVLTELSSVATLEVNLTTSISQVDAAKEVLAFYTGWDRDTPLRDDFQTPKDAGNLAALLAKIDDRPDIAEAKKNVDLFEEGIPIAFGQHYPSVDLLGDYYLDRPGIENDVKWDVQLAVTIPIFEGGEVQSQVRQARSQYRQYNLALSQARRTAEEEVRTFYDAFFSDLKLMDKLTEATDVAKKNYDAESRDYRNGLVTNLDVLTALTAWQDSQRALDHQEFLMKADYARLQAASSQRPEIYIESTRL